MNGNVWECCNDWYGEDYYSKSPATNPEGPSDGEKRAIRGGAWDSGPEYCTSSRRYSFMPVFRDRYKFFSGFRPVRIE